MAIRVFCHDGDIRKEHREDCGRYLRLRHRKAAEKLIGDGDVKGLRVCLENGIFPPEEKENLVTMAVKKGQTDCLGVLWGPTDTGGHGMEEKQPLWKRVLLLAGRRIDRGWPYLGQVFYLLSPESRESMAYMGSDGFSLFIQEKAFLAGFSADSEGCIRDVAHVLAHLLLFHPLRGQQCRDQKLWDICCDCIAEWTLEEKLGCVRTLEEAKRSRRQRVYGWLREKKVDTAAGLYRLLSDTPEEDAGEMAALFGCDDHSPWYETQHTPEKWRQQLNRLKRAAGSGAETGRQGGIRGSGGHTVKKYREPAASEFSYKQFLEQFMVPGEERILDQNSFDPILYDYSRSHYDGPVLLEPLETSEVRRLSEIVIAIDTSGSCSGEIVRQFLRETFSILEKKEHFFRRMRVHVLQCDSMIQDYRLIESESDWKAYRDQVKITGFGNTDFRPVFDWIEKNRRTGVIRDMKGLIYFTDGDGIYPDKAPEYETAFVYLNDRLIKGRAPAYVKQLNLHLDRSFANLFDDEREGRFGRSDGE